MIRSAIATEIRVLLNEATASFFTDNQIDEWIDQGQRDIAGKALCIENTADITTAAGTLEYAYTGFEVEACLYNNKGLIRVSPKQAGHIDNATNDKKPTHYFVFNQKIGILPLPTAIHTVTYYAYIDSTDFVADGSSSTLPVRYQDLMILFAFSKGLYKDSQFARAGQVYNQYINELRFLRVDEASVERDSKADMKMPDGRIVKTK